MSARELAKVLCCPPNPIPDSKNAVLSQKTKHYLLAAVRPRGGKGPRSPHRFPKVFWGDSTAILLGLSQKCGAVLNFSWMGTQILGQYTCVLYCPKIMWVSEATSFGTVEQKCCTVSKFVGKWRQVPYMYVYIYMYMYVGVSDSICMYIYTYLNYTVTSDGWAPPAPSLAISYRDVAWRRHRPKVAATHQRLPADMSTHPCRWLTNIPKGSM